MKQHLNGKIKNYYHEWILSSKERIEAETKFPKKIKFYDDLETHIKKLQKIEKNIVVMGDFNVAPTNLDIGIGEQNVKRWLA